MKEGLRMKQIMIDAYRESGTVVTAIEGEYPEELHQTMKYPDKAIRAKSQVEIGRALATMAPITHKGEPKQLGAAVAYRLENGRYIVSTANGGMPDKKTMPAIGTVYEDGKLTALYMDIQAASEFASIIAGEKPTTPAEVKEIDVDDPNIIAAELRDYEEIRGDGRPGDSPESYGMVFGHLNGMASPIPKYLHKYLVVKGDPISIGNGVIRVFDVEVPIDELEMYEHHKQIRETEMEIERAKASVENLKTEYQNEIQEIKMNMEKRIQDVKDEMDNDPAFQDAQTDLDELLKQQERLFKEFMELKTQLEQKSTLEEDTEESIEEVVA